MSSNPLFHPVTCFKSLLFRIVLQEAGPRRRTRRTLHEEPEKLLAHTLRHAIKDRVGALR